MFGKMDTGIMALASGLQGLHRTGREGVSARLTAATNSGVVHPCTPIGLRPHGVEKLAQLGVGRGILFDGVEVLQQPLLLRNFAGDFRLFQGGY